MDTFYPSTSVLQMAVDAAWIIGAFIAISVVAHMLNQKYRVFPQTIADTRLALTCPKDAKPRRQEPAIPPPTAGAVLYGRMNVEQLVKRYEFYATQCVNEHDRNRYLQVVAALTEMLDEGGAFDAAYLDPKLRTTTGYQWQAGLQSYLVAKRDYTRRTIEEAYRRRMPPVTTRRAPRPSLTYQAAVAGRATA